MKVKSASEGAQLCSTLSDPMDCSLPGSSVHGTFQARVLEWGAIAFTFLQFGWRSQTALTEPRVLGPSAKFHVRNLVGFWWVLWSVVPSSLWPHGPARLLCSWDSPGKDTAVGCHALLQRISCVSYISCIGRWILDHCTTWEVSCFSVQDCLIP